MGGPRDVELKDCLEDADLELVAVALAVDGRGVASGIQARVTGGRAGVSKLMFTCLIAVGW